MKFSCGLTDIERYRKIADEYYDHYQHWHKVFLWWPMSFSESGDKKKTCIWLGKVERRFDSLADYQAHVRYGAGICGSRFYGTFRRIK